MHNVSQEVWGPKNSRKDMGTPPHLLCLPHPNRPPMVGDGDPRVALSRSCFQQTCTHREGRPSGEQAASPACPAPSGTTTLSRTKPLSSPQALAAILPTPLLGICPEGKGHSCTPG